MNDNHRPIVLVGGTLIDGNGGPPIPEAVVLIKGRRILAVGRSDCVTIPADAKQIATPGKYLMPGMMDANVHLFFAHAPADLIRYEGLYEEVIAEAAQIALKSGVTTVFDTWGPRDALIRVRDQVKRGEIPGSRIFLAGNIIGFGGPTSTDFIPLSRSILSRSTAEMIDARWEQGVGPELLWMTPDEVGARVCHYIDTARPDFLKYAGSGHVNMQLISFSEKAQRRIVEEGHRAGLTVQAHTTSVESLRMEIEAGANLLQHGDITGLREIPEDILSLIVTRAIPCAALLVTRRFIEWNNAHGSEALRIYVHNGFKDENDRRLIAAGAQLLLTTDGGVLPSDAADTPLFQGAVSPEDSPIELGEGHFRWLEAAAEFGMKPMDALMAATRNIARAYQVDGEVGTLEAGKLADLLILDKNPLESATHYRSINTVIKEGSIVDRPSLPQRKMLTARGPDVQPIV